MLGVVLGVVYGRNQSLALMELIRESNNKCIQFLCEMRVSVMEGNKGKEVWVCRRSWVGEAEVGRD